MTAIKPKVQVVGMILFMLNRVIPIHPAPAVLAASATEPRLRGRPDQLGRLLAGLEELARAEFGSLPRSAWLRELNLDEDEAVLQLAPALRRQGAGFAQAAFELMKSELSDTDIYVQAATH